MSAPLVSPSNGLIAAVHDASDADDADAIYLGMGVATRSAVATGDMPLDALAMILLADRERSARGARRVVHLIADTHALINSFAQPSEVGRAAAALREHVARAAQVLGIGEYLVVLASEIEDSLHQELHTACAASAPNPYAARQAADVEWARLKFGASVKIGWTLESDMAKRPGDYDERYFDGIYRDIFGDKVHCVYTHPGRRLGSEGYRTSPYANEPGERRLTVAGTSCSVGDACASKSMRSHLRPLVRALRDALDLPASDDLELALTDVLAAFAPSPDHDTQEVHSRAA